MVVRPYAQRLTEFITVGKIMNDWFTPAQSGTLQTLKGRRVYPDNYFIIDTETSGFSTDNDFIVQVGWGVVRDRQLVDNDALVLDWTRHPDVDQQSLREKLAGLQKTYLEQGRTYHMTYEALQEGVDPVEGLHVMMSLLHQALTAGQIVVGHGAWHFDKRMLDSHAKEYLNTDIPWRRNSIFDTGLVEKASLLDLPPWPGEELDEWFKRVSGRRAKGIFWNLDRAVTTKYDLVPRFNLDMTQAHGAAFDCRLCYYLFETFRAFGEALKGG